MNVDVGPGCSGTGRELSYKMYERTEPRPHVLAGPRAPLRRVGVVS